MKSVIHPKKTTAPARISYKPVSKTSTLSKTDNELRKEENFNRRVRGPVNFLILFTFIVTILLILGMCIYYQA